MRWMVYAMMLCFAVMSSWAASDKWIDLLAGDDLSGWTATGKSTAFSMKDGVLHCDGSGGRLFYFHKQQFDDFILQAEVKFSPQANSGIFFRIADPQDEVQTAIEIQVLDSYGKETIGTHDFGAVYDIQAPSKNAARRAGEWNDVTITAHGPHIQVELNGQRIVHLDLSQWTQPGLNPDGTKNKFKRAYREMVHKGYIGLQDHGNPVWYRNIKVQPLSH